MSAASDAEVRKALWRALGAASVSATRDYENDPYLDRLFRALAQENLEVNFVKR